MKLFLNHYYILNIYVPSINIGWPRVNSMSQMLGNTRLTPDLANVKYLIKSVTESLTYLANALCL